MLEMPGWLEMLILQALIWLLFIMLLVSLAVGGALIYGMITGTL